MTKQVEIYYFVKDNKLIRVIENDAHTYMRKGPERRYEILCTVEEAKTKYPRELAEAEDYVD